MARILIYKGTIKASKTIFDVNDTNNLLSGSIQGYWMVDVLDSGDFKGAVLDSTAIVYDAKEKYYKVIPDSIDIDPYDPCKVVMLAFTATDPEGETSFDVVGKGKLTKYSDDPAAEKDFVPTSLKGAGGLHIYDFFDPAFTCSGPVTASLKLDSKWTRHVNANIGDYANVDAVADDIVTELTAKGGWTNWPDLTPEP